VLVSFPDPRLQTCLQQVCSVLAMSGQQIVNGISQSLTDRVKNSLQLGLFIIMVGAVLATNCKDTSNHLIVCWTNLVMHTVVMKHCSQTQGYSFPAPRLLIPSPKATHSQPQGYSFPAPGLYSFPASRLLIPSPRLLIPSPRAVLIPSPKATHSQPQGYSFPAPRLLIPSPKAVLIPSPRAVLIPSPRAVLIPSPRAVLIPSPKATHSQPQGCTHSQPQGYSFPAPGLYSFPAPGVYKHTSCLDPRLLM